MDRGISFEENTTGCAHQDMEQVYGALVGQVKGTACSLVTELVP